MLHDQPPPVPAAAPAQRPAGFWRRLAAFLVDTLLLGLLGQLLGLLWHEPLIALGPWGRAVGFCLVMLYFTPLESALGGGRSLGKRLLRLRVAGADGRPLGLGRSALRTATVALPWFLNNLLLPLRALDSPLIVPLSLLVFGAGLALVYLMIFNRGTGQGLQDLLARSYVLAEGRAAPAARIAPLHLYVAGALLALGLLAPVLAKGLLGGLIPMAQFSKADAAVMASGQAFATRMSLGTFYGKTTVHYLQIVVYLRQPPADIDAAACGYARMLLDAFDQPQPVELVDVVLRRGYDIGIASFWRTEERRLPAQGCAAAGAGSR